MLLFQYFLPFQTGLSLEVHNLKLC